MPVAMFDSDKHRSHSSERKRNRRTDCTPRFLERPWGELGTLRNHIRRLFSPVLQTQKSSLPRQKESRRTAYRVWPREKHSSERPYGYSSSGKGPLVRSTVVRKSS